jgi:protein phosphatase
MATPAAIEVPSLCLITLVGSSGAGKTTFARKRFLATEIVSSDALRGVVCDDETNMESSGDAFELLRLIVDKRLGMHRLTVVDATNVRARDRAPLIAIARRRGAPVVAIVLDVDGPTCVARNDARNDRPNSHIYVMRQQDALRASLGQLTGEGFASVHVIDAATASDIVITRR